jgi:hypothetical protein
LKSIKRIISRSGPEALDRLKGPLRRRSENFIFPSQFSDRGDGSVLLSATHWVNNRAGFEQLLEF